jgi:primosomal protein N' (replication factor Y)
MDPDRGVIARVVPFVPAGRVDMTFDYAVPIKLRDAIAVGSLVAVRFGNRNVRGIVAGLRTASDEEVDAIDPIQRAVIPYPVAPGRLAELYEWLAIRYCVPRGRAYARAQPPRVRVKATEPALGVVTLDQKRLGRYPAGDLIEAARAGKPGVWCLRTLPGEDRGAVYAELCALASEAGQSVVVVPEVAGGSLVIDSLQALLGDVARVDSELPDMERSSNWMRIARGHRFAAGGRGAALAPADPALIIVDDCHDPSLKEDRAPRYDARKVAIQRGDAATCIFGGATPPIELAFAPGTRLIEPDRGAERERRPIVELVQPPDDGGISRALHARVRDELRSGGSVALLVARRGFARTLWCGNCRRSLRCPRCEAGLSFDRAPRRVRCGRCGYEDSPPDSCPSCGASEFRFLGAGSDRLAEQIAKSFPSASVTRVDPDSAPAPAPVGSGPSIYVTTWIGTKPNIRPDVTLVGVLDADALLRRPDFRAAESGYQALAAMSEWAGPSSEGGRLVVQTAEPSHHAVQAIARADFRYFADRELELRRELGYPPFSELIKATAMGDAAGSVLSEVGAAARAAGARVLGPVPVRMNSDQGREGLQVLVKCPDALAVAEGLRGILPRVPRGTILRVDVDPV